MNDGQTVTGDELSALVIAVAQSRDRSAFARLFAYFAPRLKAFMMKKGADPATAEDLVQETMIAIWNKAPLYVEGRGAVSTWVFTIARNQRIDRLRRENNHHYADIDDYDEPSDEPGSDELLMDRQAGDRLREALAELPEEQMEVIRLAYIDDLAQSEIASRLRLPLGTVKSRMRLAYGRLRQRLEVMA
jgi:RNA polymerase sigma-70 factor, ECF subfamily